MSTIGPSTDLLLDALKAAVSAFEPETGVVKPRLPSSADATPLMRYERGTGFSLA